MQKLSLLILPSLLLLNGRINFQNISLNGALSSSTRPISSALQQAPVNPIRLNQLGFYPHAPKLAIVTGEIASSDFALLSATSADTVFRGKLGEERHSLNSSTITRVADFSAFNKPGKYVLYVNGAGSSYPFEIATNVNHAVAVASLKGYYYQRVSIPLELKYAGKWNRPAGHPDTEVLVHPSAASAARPAGTVIASPGGWYDAGDYNKYIVNSGITMGTMLSAYEDFPVYFNTLATNIPETGNQVPDILNELLYNLRWMLTMQDPNDGGVYNKCTNASFDGMVMPGITKLPRYVVAKGTAATLDFAAVTAQAARILKKFDKRFPGLADSCRNASVNAWTWCLKNPATAYDQNAINKTTVPVISTGGYGDSRFNDEWLWAAAELFITTKDNQYKQVILEKIIDNLSLPSWTNVQMLGCYSLIRSEKQLPKDMTALVSQLKANLVKFSRNLLQPVAGSAFQTVMGGNKREFNWGSNSNAANQGIALICAFNITKDKKFLDGALTNLDYLLGRNATGFCFVTGIGTYSTMHPHHRQSVADGIPEPVPGLLAGGPNPGMQDKCKYDFTEPETAYSDTDCSYASNEIAINWNAPLVYLSGAIEALQKNL